MLGAERRRTLSCFKSREKLIPPVYLRNNGIPRVLFRARSCERFTQAAQKSRQKFTSHNEANLYKYTCMALAAFLPATNYRTIKGLKNSFTILDMGEIHRHTLHPKKFVWLTFQLVIAVVVVLLTTAVETGQKCTFRSVCTFLIFLYYYAIAYVSC